MGLFNRLFGPSSPDAPAPVPARAERTDASDAVTPEPVLVGGDVGRSRHSDAMEVTLLGIEDPFLSEVINGHCTEAYKLGLERLITLDVRMRNTSKTETLSVAGSRCHLFDDQDHLTPAIAIDSRMRTPAIEQTFLPPGAAVRGWVTFCLPWERHAVRVQFFQGYLAGKVATFRLPVRSAEELAARRASFVGDRARVEVSRALDAREREVMALEARAAVALAFAEQESRARRLDERVAAANAILQGHHRSGAQQRPPPDAPDELDASDASEDGERE